MINQYLPDLFDHHVQIPDNHDPHTVADVVESLRTMREKSEDLCGPFSTTTPGIRDCSSGGWRPTTSTMAGNPGPGTINGHEY